MNGLFDAGLEVQNFLQEREWRFCTVGGLAVIRWGESRMTQDVDVCLLTGFRNETNFIDPLLKRFAARVPDARDFALRNRVLLLSASNGAPLDVSLAGIPLEEKMIERASPFAFAPDCSLITCSAEDLIVLKAFADRSIDWIDIAGIIKRQDQRLDREYITAQLAPLCEAKEAPAIARQLNQLLSAS